MAGGYDDDTSGSISGALTALEDQRMEDVGRTTSPLGDQPAGITFVDALVAAGTGGDDLWKDKVDPHWRDSLPLVDDLPQTKRYVGYQEICLDGKQIGLDIIVLTHMIGLYQVVTEMLDTRNRDECFASLVCLE